MCLSPGKHVLQATALITTVECTAPYHNFHHAKFLVCNYLNECSAKKGRIKTILYPPYSKELEVWHSYICMYICKCTNLLLFKLISLNRGHYPHLFLTHKDKYFWWLEASEELLESIWRFNNQVALYNFLVQMKKNTPRFQNQYHITIKGRKVTYLRLKTQRQTQPLRADILTWLLSPNRAENVLSKPQL